MDYQTLALLITTASGFGTLILKNYFDARKRKKDTKERDKLFIDQLIETDNKIVKLSKDFQEFKQDYDFKKKLRNAIMIKATQIINYSLSLEQKYKDLLMQYANEFEDFALRFYYSDMRGVKHEIIKFLRIDMDSRLAALENSMAHINVEKRKYKYSTNTEKWISFSDYIKAADCYKRIELLIIRLEQNGLFPEDVIELFEKFTGEFFEHFIRSIIQWKTLRDE